MLRGSVSPGELVVGWARAGELRGGVRTASQRGCRRRVAYRYLFACSHVICGSHAAAGLPGSRVVFALSHVLFGQESWKFGVGLIWLVSQHTNSYARSSAYKLNLSPQEAVAQCGPCKLVVGCRYWHQKPKAECRLAAALGHKPAANHGAVRCRCGKCRR